MSETTDCSTVAVHGKHPSSIAPLALDVTPPPRSFASAAWDTPTPPDPGESTVEIARAAGIPSRESRFVVYTASVVGMCFVAGILGVMLGYSHGPTSTAQPPSLAAPGPLAPRVAVITGAHEEITAGPILVPAKDAASILEGADERAAARGAAAAPAAAAPAAAAPARSPSSSSSTGILRLPPLVSGVLIDGVPHKAGSGGLVVPCGRHTAKAPGHPSRLVIVPCGGSAAL